MYKDPRNGSWSVAGRRTEDPVGMSIVEMRIDATSLLTSISRLHAP